MFIRTARNIAACSAAFIALYLLVAGLWAWVSVDDAVAASPLSATTLSASQTGALLTIEDPTFYTHHGLSLADGQGLTTISSSVARDVLLFQGQLPGVKGVFQRFYRGVFACCKKIDIGRDVMALVLDARVPKTRQLALYVSHAYMGTNVGTNVGTSAGSNAGSNAGSKRGAQVTGFAQASQVYFGKPLGQLTQHEFGALLAMVKAPNQFHPIKNPAAYQLRVKRVAAVLAGRCAPDGWFDTSYQHCAD